MKVVASDLGRYEQEAWVDHVTIAPAERYVVDVRFRRPARCRSSTACGRSITCMARFFEETPCARRRPRVAEAAAPGSSGQLRAAAPQRRCVPPRSTRYRRHFARPVDHELVVTLEAGDLPFPLRPLLNFESVYRNPVEWSGTMPEMDWVVTGRHGAVDPARARRPAREHGHRLALPRRRCREAAAGQRSDARSTPCSTRSTSTASGSSCCR